MRRMDKVNPQKAQVILEVVVLIIIVCGAVLLMRNYVYRAVQGRVWENSRQMSSLIFDPDASVTEKIVSKRNIVTNHILVNETDSSGKNKTYLRSYTNADEERVMEYEAKVNVL